MVGWGPDREEQTGRQGGDPPCLTHIKRTPVVTQNRAFHKGCKERQRELSEAYGYASCVSRERKEERQIERQRCARHPR